MKEKYLYFLYKLTIRSLSFIALIIDDKWKKNIYIFLRGRTLRGCVRHNTSPAFENFVFFLTLNRKKAPFQSFLATRSICESRYYAPHLLWTPSYVPVFFLYKRTVKSWPFITLIINDKWKKEFLFFAEWGCCWLFCDIYIISRIR